MNKYLLETSEYISYMKYDLAATSLRIYFEVVCEKKSFKDNNYMQKTFVTASKVDDARLIKGKLDSVAHGNSSLNKKEFMILLEEIIKLFSDKVSKSDIDYLISMKLIKGSKNKKKQNLIITKINDLEKISKNYYIPTMQRAFEWSEKRIVSYLNKLFFTEFEIIEFFIFSYNGEKLEIFDGQQRMFILVEAINILNKENIEIYKHKYFSQELSNENISEIIKKFIEENKVSKKEVNNFLEKRISISFCTREIARKIYLKKNSSYYINANTSNKTELTISNIICTLFKWENQNERENSVYDIFEILKKHNKVWKIQESLVHFELFSNFFNKKNYDFELSHVHLNSNKGYSKVYEKINYYEKGIINFKKFYNEKYSENKNNIWFFMEIFLFYLRLFNNIENNNKHDFLSVKDSLSLNLMFYPQKNIEFYFLFFNKLILKIIKSNDADAKIITNFIKEYKINEKLKIIEILNFIEHINPKIKNKKFKNIREYWESYRYEHHYEVNKELFKIALKKQSISKFKMEALSFYNESQIKIFETKKIKRIEIDNFYSRDLFDESILSLYLMIIENPFIFSRNHNWDFFERKNSKNLFYLDSSHMLKIKNGINFSSEREKCDALFFETKFIWWNRIKKNKEIGFSGSYSFKLEFLLKINENLKEIYNEILNRL